MKPSPMPRPEEAPVKEPCGCEPACTLEPFCRNNYYTGKLLTARDLKLEQRYAADKLRLHHAALHGSGVVCGLKVKPHPHCPDRRVIVEPGLAIDACGREILVPSEVEVELPKPPPPPPPADGPCPPEPDRPRPYRPQPPRPGQPYEPPCDPPEPERPAVPPDVHAADSSFPGERRQRVPQPGYPSQAPATPGQGEKGCQPPEPDEPCAPPVTLYLCIRYRECEEEFMPAPFDECGCNDQGQRPNRICEGFQLELRTEKPRPCDHECPTDDCWELYKTTLGECPKPSVGDCIHLATIGPFVLGEPVQAETIDNWTCRPLLPSTRVLDDLVRCILERLPKRKATRIKDIGWTHDGEYSFHDFHKHFVGSPNSSEAFEITFEHPVRSEGLSTRSYQAIFVHHAQASGQGHRMEVAPAKVWANADGTKFYLKVDPAYVGACGRDAPVDVFLTLRCNVIVDEHGLAVDGNLLARVQTDGDYEAAPPTGDGTPGGTFESWIHVEG